MNYMKLSKIGGRRETWIVVSFCLFFLMFLSWTFDNWGYFLRFRNGTGIKIGNVELTVPNGYYIGDKDKNEYSICNIDGQKFQFNIREWDGTPKIAKIKEHVQSAKGEVHSYTIHGYLVHEFFIRSDVWKKEYGGVVYIFPRLHLEIMYIGSLTEMYATMDKFVRMFKRIPGPPIPGPLPSKNTSPE
ncbi:MAG: hypothetical protein GXO69_04625 [Acidobacteria bacterium]|nr:hypothetical protein [Acidobacteriota bacterium]